MNVISFNKDNIYFQYTNATIDGLIMRNVSGLKQKGSCLGAIESNIYMQKSLFENYFWNCLNIEKSDISIENITLTNSIPDSVKLFGAFICKNCESFSIRGSIFQMNKNVVKGGGLYLDSMIKSQAAVLFNYLKDCFFIENHAVGDGGGICSENQHLIIKNCTFALNKGERGGGIFNTIQGSST